MGHRATLEIVNAKIGCLCRIFLSECHWLKRKSALKASISVCLYVLTAFQMYTMFRMLFRIIRRLPLQVEKVISPVF